VEVAQGHHASQQDVVAADVARTDVTEAEEMKNGKKVSNVAVRSSHSE
jgi:hypothetical protein